jgi:hypothetical protein
MDDDIAVAVAAIIAERAETNRAEWQRRRKAELAFRAERKQARDAGLRQRHAAKLARRPVV